MKDNYSDFIKKAYEAGRVKDSSEAFKDYPLLLLIVYGIFVVKTK